MWYPPRRFWTACCLTETQQGSAATRKIKATAKPSRPAGLKLLTSNLDLLGLVGLGRVELPTYGLGNRRSIHLSYSPVSLGPKFNMQAGRSRNNLDFG
jgi:hypothetical protein